jgi:hypothetical protein
VPVAPIERDRLLDRVADFDGEAHPVGAAPGDLRHVVAIPPEPVAVHATRVNAPKPIALDSDYGVWQGFGNRYWPAVYIADAEGRIRHHHFGEGAYDECEWEIQMLLREAGAEGIGDDLVSVEPDGFEAQADWTNLGSPETYVGYEQGRNFASPGGAAFDEPRTYVAPDSLQLNQWALAGDWTIERRASVLNRADGGIAFRFQGRIADRTLTIDFRAPGVEAYVFTFG